MTWEARGVASGVPWTRYEYGDHKTNDETGMQEQRLDIVATVTP